MTDTTQPHPEPSEEASSLPAYLGYDEKGYTQAQWADAQSQLNAMRAELERKSDAIQKLWKERDEACAELAALKAVQIAPAAGGVVGWQPIETASRDLSPVLLWLPPVGGWMAGPWRGSWSVIAEAWTLHTPLLQEGKAVCLTGNPEPTHWMPLPAAPQAAQKEGE